ncbi:hypothetical protein BH18THE1_BH18THE1_10580 [soil metagenome]
MRKQYIINDIGQLNLMTKVNRKLAPIIATTAMLIAAIMLANPIASLNAQENQTQGNQTNQTKAAGQVVTKIDVDPLMKALKDNYPKIGDVKDPKGLVDALKDIKDPKEVARNMVAAGLMQDLEKFKAMQDSE